MSKIELTVVIFLPLLLCTSLLQIAESQDAASDKVETAKIRVPDKGVTIILRAPTSESYHLVKVSKGRDGKLDEKQIDGLTVSLPRNTPVFFMVDQVNTVLYNVEISVAKQESKDTETDGDGAKARDTSAGTPGDGGVLEKFIAGSPQVPETTKLNIEKVLELNNKLDGLLHRSEMLEFYKVDPDKRFKKIQTDAKDIVLKTLGTSRVKISTSQEIRNAATTVIAAVRAAYIGQNKEAPPLLLKSIREAFVKTADKLQAIETAVWFKRDTEDRVLTGTIKYTCSISPSTLLSKKYAELASKRIVVTVSTVEEELSGFNVTLGALITRLPDESYVNIKDKIVRGSQDDFSKQFGVLAHLPLWSHNFSKFRAALAISGGVAGIISLKDQSVNFDFKTAEPALGVSVLFASRTGNNLFVLTVGGIAKSVKRLNGYCVGDPYPKGELMRTTNEKGWFCAITYSYDVIERLKNLGLK